MAFFELKNVSKNFGGLMAVGGMSFSVDKGDIVGLIGPNGAGKTTLFNLINGYFAPSSGSVNFKEENISGLKPHLICHKGIARTFQVVKPLARLSVLDNVIVSAFSQTGSMAKARAIAEEAVNFTEMEKWIQTPAKGLPLGMRKRLELARAIATKPEMLLLDENFAGLNATEVENTIGIVKKIHSSGVTIIMIEHNMRVIMSISNKIVAISYGEKITEGTPSEVTSNPQVIEAYLGEQHA